MSNTVVPFPLAASARSPLAHFIRIGEAHKKLADLYASGRLPVRKVVIEASRMHFQRELIAALRDDGVEIVLDTEAAELAARAKAGGHSRHAPWASAADGKLLGPEYFRRNEPTDVIGRIARTAIEYSVDTVLAPAHYLADPEFSNWLSIDSKACTFLRAALDRHGGKHIAIDYLVIAPHTQLNSNEVRGRLTEVISDLPVDNVWVRASGLGTDAGPQTMRRYLSAIGSFHNLGKPIIADHLGGLPALAAMTFGAVSGVAHGIGERERFDARSWHKPPPARKAGDEFGRAVRIGIPGLGKTGTIKELELLASAKGGRRLVACGDRYCCQHGLKDMINDPRRHAAYQAIKPVQALEEVPALSREHYFLNGPMLDADRLARGIKQLKPSETEAQRRDIDLDKLMKRYHDHSRKLEQLRTTLEKVHESRSDEMPRARPVAPRLAGSRQTREDRK